MTSRETASSNEREESTSLRPDNVQDNVSNDASNSNSTHARPRKPLIFLPPPIYPSVDVQTAGHFRHGQNEYTLFSTSDQNVFYEALKLRCDRQCSSDSKTKGKKRLSRGVDDSDVCTAPPPTDQPMHKVVAIDCEMVSVVHEEAGENKSRNELAQLCAVDVLTGKILIDKLVRPDGEVKDFRTKYSGLSSEILDASQNAKRCFEDWRAAREELLSYIDSGTIIVGHAVHNDLRVLRLKHEQILDISLQTAEAVFGYIASHNRVWGLKNLAKALMDLDVQGDERGHDCIEDTLATRELALWCIRNPKLLEAWAQEVRPRVQEERIKLEKKLEEEAKQRETEKMNKRKADELESDAVASITAVSHDAKSCTPTTN